MKPKFFEYALDGIRASVHYTKGNVTLGESAATHGKTRVGLASGLVVLIVGLLALTGPPLGAAMAQLAAKQEDLLPGETAQ